MKIPNYNKGYEDHEDELFEPPVRLLVSGPSNSGKTNIVCHLIRQFIIPYDSI